MKGNEQLLLLQIYSLWLVFRFLSSIQYLSWRCKIPSFVVLCINYFVLCELKKKQEDATLLQIAVNIFCAWTKSKSTLKFYNLKRNFFPMNNQHIRKTDFFDLWVGATFSENNSLEGKNNKKLKWSQKCSILTILTIFHSSRDKITILIENKIM